MIEDRAGKMPVRLPAGQPTPQVVAARPGLGIEGATPSRIAGCSMRTGNGRDFGYQVALEVERLRDLVVVGVVALEDHLDLALAQLLVDQYARGRGSGCQIVGKLR